MYKQFFGFKERPFHLTPNPAFLYLSKSHEEALAHLTYALSQGDGFVEIIGEVGTGKTTLCRAFLADLDDSTNAAYIFNPKLDAIQLLKAINDEFAIDSTADNAKELIDRLNAFLMQSRSAGQKVILLIDEAQNLTPSVLEQLRLLSNLETATDKLLQIIMVGQPELGVMLDSYELRQLGQRITLNCYLAPLNFIETKEYINHRLHIAASKKTVKFDRASFRLIYKYSRGIPRRINIVCDRVLLTAFGLDTHKINGKIVKIAIRELSAHNAIKRHRPVDMIKIVLVPLILIGIAALSWVLYPYFNFRSANDTLTGRNSAAIRSEMQKQEYLDQKAATDVPVNAPQKAPLEFTDLSETQLGGFLSDTKRPLTRPFAMQAVAELWQMRCEKTDDLDRVADDLTFFSAAMKTGNLSVFEMRWDFELVQKLNLPAILRFTPAAGGFSRYLALIRLEDGKAILKSGNQAGFIAVRISDLTSALIEKAYIPWKNFRHLQGSIPKDAPDDSMLTLKRLLRNFGFQNIPMNTDYDPQTTDAVKMIQARHGMKIDGVVGVLTKIILYNEAKTFAIPHLR